MRTVYPHTCSCGYREPLGRMAAPYTYATTTYAPSSEKNVRRKTGGIRYPTRRRRLPSVISPVVASRSEYSGRVVARCPRTRATSGRPEARQEELASRRELED
jgi:hypothetical protein